MLEERLSALKEELAAKQAAVQELGKGLAQGLTQLTHLPPHTNLRLHVASSIPQTGL